MRLVVAMGALLLAAATCAAQAPPPSTKVMNCTTAGCHAKELDHKFLHGPTAVSACDVCHSYADPVKHTFVLKRTGRQLCETCHIDKTGTEGPFVHAPVATGDCTGCHDPHGAETHAMLNKPSMTELCLTCHTDVLNGQHVHQPVAESCTACHQAHTSTHEKLLTTDKRSLCLTCHADVGQTISTAPHPHQPAVGDCLQCHQPHVSDQAFGLRSPPKDLCLSCHAEVGAAISTAAHQHSATTDAKACLNCHTPHGSKHVMQLLEDPVAACLECHAKPIEAPDHRIVAAVAEIGAPGMHKHGAIEDGDCATCHTVHGGSEAKLLILPYEQTFYQRYTETSYGLCFKCHDRATLLGKEAPGTGFRNGAVNLHTVHVAKPSQGRSCRACHTIHAGRFDKLIAESTMFGEWKLPINYIQTETGGSCAPGCHKAKAYDRLTPVPVEDAAPK